MTAVKKCPHCGSDLGPDGHCLACLLQLGLPPVETGKSALKPGDRIGNYILREQLGEGGYGLVFLAEQEEPVRREVALKIIKPGMDTHEVMARFDAERQVLALLEHPNIARVFDAGTTDSGHPFFVMELVRGVKITEYCDAEKLSMSQRLQLFIPICQAIQHAHLKGIIHRDLKPSNILIVPGTDGSPALPKIIDFGIAKSMEPRSPEHTTTLALQQFVGTPTYMSPEQVGLDAVEIDGRSDLYSLGVLLYELLTGRAPFEAEDLRRCAVDQILRFIREAEPPRPSARLTGLTPPQLTSVAVCRQIDPAKLPKLLRGDLDWIVMKCLEKERARRYATATGLAADLQHYLANEPVTARPPTQIYRLRKLVRRNRLAFAAGFVLAATIAIGAGISTHLFFAARQEHRRTMLAEATSLSNLGAALWGQHHYADAEMKYREALAIRREFAGPENPAVAVALNNLATVLLSEGRAAEAEALNRQALAMDRKFLGNEHPDVAIDLANLATALAAQNKFADAEQLDRQALALDRRISGGKNPHVPPQLENLAKDLAAEGKNPEAAAVRLEAEQLRSAAK